MSCISEFSFLKCYQQKFSEKSNILVEIILEDERSWN